MFDFEFVRATSLAEAASIVKGDEEAKFLGGGQTFLASMKQRLASPSKLVSLSEIAEIQGVARDGDCLIVGGGTTHASVALETSRSFPGLSSLAARIGDPAVRNRGTIGGSLANNDPAACYPSAVLSCGATIVTDKREIAADDFFQGVFATALEHGEIITAVRFPIPEAANYQKFIQPASRFSLCGIFVAKYADRVGVAVTGASEDGVFRWSEGEERLSNDFTSRAVEDLVVSPESMIEDLFGSKDYRAHLIPVLTARAVAEMQAQ